MNGSPSEFNFSEAALGATPDPKSDWDILVVVADTSGASADSLVPWRLRRDTGVRADVIIYSAREFEAERDVPNTLAYEAASAGVALYER